MNTAMVGVTVGSRESLHNNVRLESLIKYWEIGQGAAPVYTYRGEQAELEEAVSYLPRTLPVGDSKLWYIVVGANVWVMRSGMNVDQRCAGIVNKDISPDFRLTSKELLFRILLERYSGIYTLETDLILESNEEFINQRGEIKLGKILELGLAVIWEGESLVLDSASVGYAVTQFSSPNHMHLWSEFENGDLLVWGALMAIKNYRSGRLA